MMGNRCRVLLADDTSEIRLLLRLALEMDGRFEIIGEAEDGVEALKLTLEHSPDAVVLDLAMPVMDGLAALPGIKQAAPGAKILVLTGFDAGSLKQEALDAGADAFLEKGEATKSIVKLLEELCVAAA
jgi:DNA-binding NarL/FixJ family response regulator